MKRPHFIKDLGPEFDTRLQVLQLYRSAAAPTAGEGDTLHSLVAEVRRLAAEQERLRGQVEQLATAAMQPTCPGRENLGGDV